MGQPGAYYGTGAFIKEITLEKTILLTSQPRLPQAQAENKPNIKYKNNHERLKLKSHVAHWT